MTNNATSGAADLPEALRVPLDSLHADAGYLCGRLLNGSLTQEQVVESIRRRIDAAKLAALTAQAISAEPAAHVQNPAEIEHVAGDVSKNGAGSNTAYAELLAPDATTVGLGAVWNRHSMRDFADRTHAIRVATHGQAPAQPVDFTTLGAAMRAIQQAIGLIGDPADERMQAVRRVLRGAVVVAEDSEDIPAQPAPPADSVLYDPKAVLDVFNSARAGSEKPVGYLRGILAVIAHWENRPAPHRWMVPARADSVLEDAALLQEARNALWQPANVALCERIDAYLDAARKQGGSHD